MVNINREIKKLIEYGLAKNLIDPRDRTYIVNRLVGFLDLLDYEEEEKVSYKGESIGEILENFRSWAVENERVEDDSIEVLDIFDTEVMACLTKLPSQIEEDFWLDYQESKEKATDNYYKFAKDINYIREDRIAKDIRWIYPSLYGDLDITINMSKPEKDPRAIARARHMKSASYPKCALCRENEGYPGRLGQAARGNHRLIELDLANEEWFLQYSPYVYYNEHCIVLKGQHEPMKINDKTFRRLLEFVEIFPHYFIGSNAGLPIVGGSILSHDHFQGGRYDFAMAGAREENHLQLKNNIEASTLNWPMTVIRLKGKDIDSMVEAAYEVLKRWEDYNDQEAYIYSETKGEPHNAITPICRFRKGLYELDLVLRNNITTEERPDGLFHPRPAYHHIKKENIGLIEVMGLAVLPSRLKKEMEEIKKYLLRGDLASIEKDQELKKHYSFALNIYESYSLEEDNVEEIIEKEVGRVFLKVLEDAGIFKDTEEGRKAFKRCREDLLKNLLI